MSSKLNLDVSKRVDITCRRGDTLKVTLTVKDDSGTAVDLSSYSDFKFEVRTTDTSDTAYADGDATIILSTEDDSSGSKYVSSAVSGTDSNTLTFTASATNMKAVASGMYVYDIEATNSSSEVQTWVSGLFVVNEDVTV